MFNKQLIKEQLMEEEIQVYDFKSEKFDKLIKKNNEENEHYFFYLPRRVKLTHLVTGEQAFIDNLPMAHQGIYHGNFYIVCCGEHENKLTSMHHVNINGTVFNYGIAMRHFCLGDYNGTSRDDFLKDYNAFITTLAFQFEEQNPSNGYSQPYSTMRLFELEYPIRYADNNSFISNDKNCLELIRRLHMTLENLGNIDVSKGYWYKTNCTGQYQYTKNKDYAEEHHESKYYKLITPEDIEQAYKDMMISCGALFVGCGSAGSNIATQLARTNIVDDYLLVDMDKVERHNLRNQIYFCIDILIKKSEALKRYIEGLTKTSACVTKEFQSIEASVKAKYLFNMLDSLILRKQCAEKFNSDYIIDARYHKLSASLFIIDRSKEDEVKYYNDNLDASIKSDITDYKFDEAELYGAFNWDICRRKIRRICKELDKCCSVLCKRKKEYYDNLPVEYKDKLIQIVDGNRQTCNSPNIIDIYTITAGIIVRALAQVNDGKDKPFTHLEIDTQTGLPRLMVVKE